jgi:hypothetical protein
MTNFDGAPPPPRSALTLRLILAIFGLVVSVSAAVTFAVLDVPLGFVVVAVLAAAIAAVDIVVITRRKLRHDPG